MKTKHFLFTLLICCVSIGMSAAEWTDANGTVWKFTTSGSNATLYGSTSTPCISGTIPTNLVIPSIVYIGETAYSVNKIGYTAFYGCLSLTSINIPESVTSIGNNAFNGCSSLTSINIPEGVTAIERYAFQNCSSLTSINIPEGVTAIGESAFQGCSSLTSINIPEGVTAIGESAFQGCSRLTSINIPEGVTAIGGSAFWGCSSLTSINIPEGVTAIGDYAFLNCSSLTSINIPEGVTAIGGSAFQGCSSLTSINIPEGVTAIGGSAFSGCNMAYMFFGGNTPCTLSDKSSIATTATLIVPDDAVDTYRTAWPDFQNVIVGSSDNVLKTVNVTANESSSNLANQIGEENLLKVTKLKVTGTINSYDMMVIRNKMINLRELDLEEANIVANDYQYYQGYHSEDDVFGGSFLKDTKIMSVVLPTTVTSIGYYAFSQCYNLRSVSNWEGVEILGDYAFESCSNLKEIDLPNSLTYIGECAFSGCSALSSITIPQGVATINSRTFEYCYSLQSVQLSPQTTVVSSNAFSGCSNLKEFHLPPYLQSIGDYTFSDCRSLKDIYAYMVDVPTISTNTFNDYQHQTLYVPEFLYNKYYYDTNWSQFLEVKVCALQPGDYENFYANSDVTFEDGVERIPEAPDAELGEQGGIIVEGDTPQPFDEVDQNVDGDGTGASLIGEDNGETQGNLPVNKLRVKLQVKADKWYFFSFPYDVTIADCEYPGQYVWRTYDGLIRAMQGANGWKNVEGEKLLAGQGYIFQSSAKGKLIITFDRPSFGGDKPKPLASYTTGNGNAANASWNFVGNPYSCYYSIDENDFSAPITVWNGSSYEAYRPGDDDYHLQPYQAFFVQKPESVEEINFEAERRETYTQSEKKKKNQANMRRAQGIAPERLLINLTIGNDETADADRTRVVLNEKASHNYELECDAAKFMSGEAAAQIYTVENGVQMAINERPSTGDIRLGYSAQRAGTLHIEASRMDMPMLLLDTQKNMTFDLSLGAYEFETEAGTNNTRFMLLPSNEATAIRDLKDATGVVIGMQKGGLNFGGAEGKQIVIYNTNGTVVAQPTGNGFVSLPMGTYVVKVGNKTAKMFVK